MRKDNLRLLVTHHVHRWDNGAAPLPILEMRANSAQAAVLQAVLRSQMIAATNRMRSERTSPLM